MSSRINLILDKAVIFGFIMTVFVLGGKPVSPIVFRALEEHYGVPVPSYNINELMQIVDRGNAALELKQSYCFIKLKVKSFSDFEKLLESNYVSFTRVPGTSKQEHTLKVDGGVSVNNLKALMTMICTENICIKVNHLNDTECVIVLEKGDHNVYE